MDGDLQPRLHKLASYAAQGKWNNVVEFASHYNSAAPLAVQQQDHQHIAHLAFTGYKVLALMRLRRYALAGDELAQLGNVPGQQLPAGVPFGLLYLRAQLPACRGSPQLTLDLLYQLRDYCLQQKQKQWSEQQQQQQQEGPVPAVPQEGHTDQQQQSQPPGSAAAVALWQQRLHAVDSSLILHYWQQGSVITACKLLDQQLQEQPHSIELWSLARRLQLQLNMLHQAHASFTKVQQIFLQQQQQQHRKAATSDTTLLKQHLAALQRLVHHNWGCYHALSHNMTLAQHEFSIAQHIRDPSSASAAAAASDPLAAASEPETNSVDHSIQAAAAAASVDGIAAANSAVCLLHMGELTEAISALEAGLQQHPQAFLQECTLYNLGMMYDLAYPPAIAKQTRHQLASSVLRLAADDFDLSCIE